MARSQRRAPANLSPGATLPAAQSITEANKLARMKMNYRQWFLAFLLASLRKLRPAKNAPPRSQAEIRRGGAIS
jgi:hypothetical protein